MARDCCTGERFWHDSKQLLSCACRWLIVAFHEPYYTTQSSPALAQYFKQHLESLFYASAVDVVVNGHIHAYERSYPVYNNAVRRAGSIFLHCVMCRLIIALADLSHLAGGCSLTRS